MDQNNQYKNYDEKLLEKINYAERNVSDNIDTENGMNREEGEKKKNDIDN